MKRIHVHVRVADLDRSIGFYSTMFGAPPTVLKPDYAKWMLEDPRVNFAISERSGAAGLDHLGIQVDDGAELAAVSDRLQTAGEAVADQKGTTCCYARSDKAWVKDPTGISWETFRTFGETTTYGEAEPGRGVRTAAVSAAAGKAATCCASGGCGGNA